MHHHGRLRRHILWLCLPVMLAACNICACTAPVPRWLPLWPRAAVWHPLIAARGQRLAPSFYTLEPHWSPRPGFGAQHASGPSTGGAALGRRRPDTHAGPTRTPLQPQATGAAGVRGGARPAEEARLRVCLLVREHGPDERRHDQGHQPLVRKGQTPWLRPRCMAILPLLASPHSRPTDTTPHADGGVGATPHAGGPRLERS